MVEESSVVSNVEITDNEVIMDELKDSPPVTLIDVGAVYNKKNNVECFGQLILFDLIKSFSFYLGKLFYLVLNVCKV